jgi:hypothetical protein
MEITRRARWNLDLDLNRGSAGHPLLAGGAAVKSALKAASIEETKNIRRFALGALLTLAWIGLLLWCAVYVVLAVM